MTSKLIFAGAAVITLGLVIAGLFSQPASAFSEHELRKLDTTVRLNLADDADPSSGIVGRGDMDLYLGADQRDRMRIETDNLYSSNLIIESKPVQIGRFRFRF